jgi:UDP-N-acetylglucosamine 4-epimerase
MKESPQSPAYKVSESSFLVTGGAGFIGCNIVKELLARNARKIVILDNLATGFKENISAFLTHPSVQFIEGDIRDATICSEACKEIDFVFHHAALGSIPRSIDTPLETNSVNVTGFLNMLNAARLANVKKFVYASSSSVYGDDASEVKLEERTGNPLSPYAVTKIINELYAEVFHKTYGMPVIGLRYFNVFGPSQNMNGPYAAVVPIFINRLLNNETCRIFGDGENTRDFTYVENVVSAVIKAGMSGNTDSFGKVFNVACGTCTSVNSLYHSIAKELGTALAPEYAPARKGDIVNSLADISKAQKAFGYAPAVSIEEGLRYTLKWYQNKR